MNPFERYLPALEAELRRIVSRPTEGPALLYGMLHYHLGWADQSLQPQESVAGKRLRPVFLFLCCEAVGGHWERAMPAAVAVELLHNFSLIHDDIEDRDSTRRGRPTLWALWGEAQAINAGDALFALAYRALFELRHTGASTDRVFRALVRFDDTVLRLTEGQCLDMAFETETDVTEATYLRMIAGKTATLLGLACELGALLADAPTEQVSACFDFGFNLGLSFQMQDDLLGLWGDPARTGKPVGADLRNGKKTLPILHGMAQSPDIRRQIVALAQSTPDDEMVGTLCTALDASGSRNYTETLARKYQHWANQALLHSGGQGPAFVALQTLSDSLLGRDH